MNTLNRLPSISLPAMIFAASLAIAGTASAQVVEEVANAEPEQDAGAAPSAPAGSAGALNIRVGVGGGYVFDTDIDDGGEFSMFSAGTRIDARYRVNEQNSVSVGFLYEYNDYDFSGSRGFGGLDPWEEVHSFALRATWILRIDDQWSIFVGPTIALEAEDGAVTSNAMTFGGTIAAQYRASDTLTLGFGVLGASQIDDDARFVPLANVNWKFAENWELRAGAVDRGSRLRGRPTAEVAWQCRENWELAFGLEYDLKRFRLDDRGVAPDGVGKVESLPIYARLLWNFGPRSYVAASVGVALGGEFTLENDNGSKITDEDFDPAPFVALRLSHSF